MEALLKLGVTTMIAYSTHYGTVKLYDYFCVPDGITGFLQGLLTVGSPVCELAVKVVSSTQISYSTAILMGLSRAVADMALPA